MGKVIVYNQQDGTCAVIAPAPDSGLTIEQVAEKDVPAGRPYKIVDAADLPADREYRDAWTANIGTGQITHDMSKAREIHKEKLRRMRAPLLQALDEQYLRADEQGDAERKAQIAAKKQALRDVTIDPSVAGAKTIDALKSAVPAVLKEVV